MNKTQWLLIVFSLVAFLDHEIFGPGIVFYLFLSLAIILFFFLSFKRRFCSNCGTKLPIIRKPDTLRATFLGGWTCPKCKQKLDSSGRVIKQQ